jgi:hypothetical protein
MNQQTLELKETRTPNNVLTAAEMFRLTREIEKRALTAGIDPAESWAEAEATFAELLGRPVTRPNIITALTALDGVSQSRVVKPRGVVPTGNGDLDSKIESLDGRIGRLASDVGLLERVGSGNAADITTVAKAADLKVNAISGRVDFCEERLEEIDEVLARDTARLDTFESWREAIRASSCRHEAAIGQLVQQNTELVGRVKILEVFVEKLCSESTGEGL